MIADWKHSPNAPALQSERAERSVIRWRRERWRNCCKTHWRTYLLSSALAFGLEAEQGPFTS